MVDRRMGRERQRESHTGAGVELGGDAAGQDIAGLGGGLDIEEAYVGGEGITSFEGRHFLRFG